MSQLRPATLELSPDGTPFSTAYGDVYHTKAGGPAQARHVFLAGNNLPTRWQGREAFVIFETGFGLGLNFLATWQAWRADPERCGRLHFVSIEKHPFAAADLAVAHAAWPEFAELAQELRQHWPMLVSGIHRLRLNGGQVVLTLVFADATTCLNRLDLAADAFYLDGFSPAKNPELWTPWVCQALARLAAPGASLATWSVASGVRQGLEAAEFDLAKRPGFAGKREMLVGQFRSRRPLRRVAPPPAQRHAIVLGAGVAGTSAAAALAQRGWQVTVLEQAAAPAQGASGNLAGVLRPLPSLDDNRLARLTRAGFLATRRHIQDLQSLPHLQNAADVRWQACGVLHLGRDDAHAQTQAKVASQADNPDYVQFWAAAQVSAALHRPVPQGGWWFPHGGWVQPPSLCRANLAAFPTQITTHFSCPVASIRYDDNPERSQGSAQWLALDAQGKILASAPYLIMASGVAAPQFAPCAWLPQKAARGQVSHLPQHAVSHPPDFLVCGNGYLAPNVDGWHVAGATLSTTDSDSGEHLADHVENLRRINQLIPEVAGNIAAESLHGRVGFRPMSPDRLPLVGAMPDAAAIAAIPPQKRRLRQLPVLPGLWAMQGFGARGIVWSALMADLLASTLHGEPLPLETDLVEALLPGRFLLHAAEK